MMKRPLIRILHRCINDDPPASEELQKKKIKKLRFISDTRHCGFKTERFVVVVPRLSAHEFNEILLSFLVQDGTDKKLHTHQT